MMTIMYKLVEQNNTTRGGMTWAIGRTNVATGRGNKLCTSGVLHCYSSPYLAVLFNPIHGGKRNPILYKIECSPIVDGDGLKFATKRQTPVEQLQLPIFTEEQLVAFAIKCALLVYKDYKFVSWAENWLSGADRSESAARSAARSAAESAESARSTKGARSAAWSAESARSAAWSVESDARSAAWSAESAARSAAWSVESAAAIFDGIARWVLDNIS